MNIKTKSIEWKNAYKSAKEIKKNLKKFSKKSYIIINDKYVNIIPQTFEDRMLYETIRNLYREDGIIKLDVDSALNNIGLKFFNLPKEPYDKHISFMVA